MLRTTDELSLLTTESLLSHARTGSNSAWKVVLLRYKMTLISAAVQHIGERADVEDIVQEAFVKSVSSIEGFRYTSEGSFRRYLLSIVINHCYDLLRAKKPFEEVDFAEVAKPTSGESEPLRIVELTSALNKLPKAIREIVLLKKYEGKSWKEVSSIVEESESSARRKYALAISQLRTTLS